MPRGQTSPVGQERTAPNGYTYIKTEEGWELKSRVLAEKKLGRALRAQEYVAFDDGDRTNLDPTNLTVLLRGRASLKRELIRIENKIVELEASRQELIRRLKIQEKL